MTTIYAADLFAGAGGASLGLARACAELGYELELAAVNHWPVAVATHLANFPAHVHYCQTVDTVNPLEAVPGGYLDLLMAGPSCTHFSRARGGKPKNKQSRASAYDIIHWLEVLYVQSVIIENVKEFRDWGPLDEEGKVIPEFKGRDFRLFLGALEELGYTVEHRLLRSCDYGDPTSRERLFIIATRGGSHAWPVPSHVNPKLGAAFPDRKPWRTAREVIDWSIKGTSIYKRKEAGLQPLAENTLRRIFAGVRKFSGLPFIVPQFSEGAPTDTAVPLGTITTTSRGVGIALPYVVQMAQTSEGDERRCYTLDQPLTTITTKNSQGFVEPLLVVFRNNSDGASLDKPIGALCTSPGHFALVEPIAYQEPIAYLTAAKNEAEGQIPRTHDLKEPMPTVVAQGRPGDLVEAFLTLHYGGHDARALDVPLQTVAAQWNHFGLAQTVPLPDPVPPFLVRYNGGPRAQSMEAPVTTLDTSNRFALCEFVVEYNGTGSAVSLAEPSRTITGSDRFGLVELQVVGEQDGQLVAEGRIVGWLDILFRMLQPHELAAAQGFPTDYHFTGNREDQVAQIGNAWSGELAKALSKAAIQRPNALLRPVPNFAPLHVQLRDKVISIAEDIPADMPRLLDLEPLVLVTGGEA